MIEKHALANSCGGVNVALEGFRRAALQVEREILAPGLPQRMGQAMGLQRVKALEIQQRLDKARAGRIAIGHRHHIEPERLDNRGVARDHVQKRLPDQIAGHFLMVEPVSQPMDDRALQPVMIEDRTQHKARHFRLAAHDLLGLYADARKHRIDVAKADDVTRDFS